MYKKGSIGTSVNKLKMVARKPFLQKTTARSFSVESSRLQAGVVAISDMLQVPMATCPAWALGPTANLYNCRLYNRRRLPGQGDAGGHQYAALH